MRKEEKCHWTKWGKEIKNSNNNYRRILHLNNKNEQDRCCFLSFFLSHAAALFVCDASFCQWNPGSLQLSLSQREKKRERNHQSGAATLLVQRDSINHAGARQEGGNCRKDLQSHKQRDVPLLSVSRLSASKMKSLYWRIVCKGGQQGAQDTDVPKMDEFATHLKKYKRFFYC